MSSPVRPNVGDTFSSPVAASPIQHAFPHYDQRPPVSSRTARDAKRDSTASSAVSSGGALDTARTAAETVAESSQNAISTLLQPPIVRTGLQPYIIASSSGFKLPTQRDIPPVALTNIPQVEAKVFQPYLSEVGSLYDAFQRAKLEGDGDQQLFRREKRDAKSEEWEQILSGHLQRPPPSRTGSVASVTSVTSPMESPRPIRRGSAQRRAHTVTPLSTIPSVYSDADFRLENPRTFDIVSERSDVVRDPNTALTGRKTLATNAILQEKLSWYMDTVEIHLISSISTASKSFFSALGSLRELHSEAVDSVSHIQKLRKDLAMLDKEMAMGGLKVVHLKQRRDNVRKLAEAIMQLDEIVAAVRKCDDMVQRGEVDGALDDLDKVEDLIAGIDNPSDREIHREQRNKAPVCDLRGIRALDGAIDDLDQLRFRVGKTYEARLLATLLGDIRGHIGNVPIDMTLRRWGTAFTRLKAGQRRQPSEFPAYMKMDPELRSDLAAQMKGLSRAKHTPHAATAFRAAILREMKTLIRKHLPSSTDDDNESTISASTYSGRGKTQQDKSSILARNLRSLDADDSYGMLSRIYANSSEALRRLGVQVKILLDITSSIDEPNMPNSKSPLSPQMSSVDRVLSPTAREKQVPTISVQAEIEPVLDLSSLLGEAVDTIQSQITKIVKVRSQQNAELPVADFIRFFSLNRLFADECEAISGRSGLALKSVVDSQIKDFVTQLCHTQRQSLVETMDSDKWDAKDFGDRENKILSRVVDGGTGDASQWFETSLIWEPVSGPENANGALANGISTAAKEKVRSAVIDEQKFILPESALAMLRAIETFEHLTIGISSMSSEAASSLLDCLKLFNSRSSQLILGAGATRSAGLKNITTKHLALSSQALSFTISLIPYIREFFRRHVSTSVVATLMTEFDKVKRLLQEHQSGIHEKLVEIMSSRAANHISAMKKIDWEDSANEKVGRVSPYMEALTKETATLQKVLSKHLPQNVLGSIMLPVFASYREQWSKAYGEVSLKSITAKERLLADVEFFNTRLSKLEGSGDLGDFLVNLVTAKPVISSVEANPTKKGSIEEQRDDPKPSTAEGEGSARTEADADGEVETGTPDAQE